MIRILIPADSPRTDYALELVFSRIIGLPYEMVTLADYQHSDETPLINYTQLIIPGAFSIPNAGLLRQTDIHPVDLRIATREIPFLFHFTASSSSYHLEFDIFSAVFFLASDYEKYISHNEDFHQRYDQAAYPSAEWGLNQLPLVHLYCENLKQCLCAYFPGLETAISSPEPDFQLTWDIDFPWKYFHKDARTSIGGFFKDLVSKRWSGFAERTLSWVTGRDPNYTFDRIFALCPPEKTTFFFLIDRHSPHDSRFTWKNPHLVRLIQEISARRYHTAIHPSYTSFCDREKIEAEIAHLAHITGKAITRSRQHFLRYRLPDTFRFLSGSGITREFSLCRFADAGFPCGMAVPFPWFDLEKNETTNLTLYPTIAMDRTLQQYMGLGPEEAVSHLRILWKTTCEYRGLFTLLLHNDVLSESEEWKGWRAPVSAFLKELAG
ncbi:MAG: hypothetical protein R3C61_19305 [Bacteroidia bacterium]